MDSVDSMSLTKFCDLHHDLLSLERAAELAQSEALLSDLDPKELCRRGLGLHNLTLAGSRTGLFGRTVLTLEVKDELPANNISNGNQHL